MLIKFVSETIKNKAKEQKGKFVGMLLAASLFEIALAGKRVRRGGDVFVWACKEVIRVG